MVGGLSGILQRRPGEWYPSNDVHSPPAVGQNPAIETAAGCSTSYQLSYENGATGPMGLVEVAV
jgi:hypothetical protein